MAILLQTQEVTVGGKRGKVMRYDSAKEKYTIKLDQTGEEIVENGEHVIPHGPILTEQQLNERRAVIQAQLESMRLKRDQPQRIDARYGSFKVEPKPEERGDRNFPPNLHAACQLFCMTRNVPLALQCKKDVDAYLAVLQEGPDGKSSHRMGKACICWLCGHVGIPSNMADCAKNENIHGKCGKCGSMEQTNFVRVEQRVKAGESPVRVIPWMQLKHRASADAVKAAADLEAKSNKK
eukprot:g1475.t1